jgi:hypothetical protein
MSATGANHQSERTPLRRESRTWGLIRRTLTLGRSMGSLSYLISVGLIASWIIAVFFGVGLFFLMPRSAKLASGLSPGGSSFDASLWLTQATSRLDRLSNLRPPAPTQPMGDAAADRGRPVVGPGSPTTAKVIPLPAPAQKTIAHTLDEPPEPASGLNRGQALTVGLGTISAATGEAVPSPAPPSQLSTAPEPRGAPQSSRSSSVRKPLERRPSNARTAQPHAPVSAIQDVLQKHSHVIK